MDFQDYTATTRFTNVQMLLGNHFKFVIDALPDLSFFVQSVILPDVSSTPVKRGNPFTRIPEVGDHLDYGSLHITFLLDNAFKSYFSLLYWLKGYAFPHDYQESVDFNTSRARVVGNPRPSPREIQKTNATLYILQPDTDTTIAEVIFADLFPSAIGQVSFSTTPQEPAHVVTQVTFHYTDFDVQLVNP